MLEMSKERPESFPEGTNNDEDDADSDDTVILASTPSTELRESRLVASGTTL